MSRSYERPFTPKGIKRVKVIFRQSKGDRTFEQWAKQINDYWGTPAFSTSNLHYVVVKSPGLKAHHIKWLAPFTQYSEEILLAIAREELVLEGFADSINGA